MTETKKKKLLIGLVAAVLIVVFFFAGFGAGYSTGKGADSAPDADAVPGGGLYVENGSSDGLKVATLSATRTASSSDPYGFDYFNSPFRSEDSDRHVIWFSAYDSHFGTTSNFVFDSYSFLEVAYSDGTPIESSADIEWTLTCEDAYWDVVGKNWKEYFKSNLTLLGDQPVENGFFDLAVYEDEAHARLGCKCPFFFPVTLSVKVTTREKKVYTADLSVGYRKSRAERSALELYFGDGIGSISTWGYSGGHDDALGIDYVALRVPIYSLAIVADDADGINAVADTSYWTDYYDYSTGYLSYGSSSSDVSSAYLRMERYREYNAVFDYYNLVNVFHDSIRLDSGFRYLAANYLYDSYNGDYSDRFGTLDPNLSFSISFDGVDLNEYELGFWTEDDYTMQDSYPELPLFAYGWSGYVEMNPFEVMLGPGFRNGGLYAGIGDPYDELAELLSYYWDEYLTHTGPDDVTVFNIEMHDLKSYFQQLSEVNPDGFSQNSDWSLTDFCMWPGAVYGSDDFDTALACIKEGARKYLADPASYKWEPTYYIRCPDGGWLGVGLDFSGGPNGYRGISA